ncbi:dihydroorotate dehydrogenase (NAD+) catalytic subunit [Hungatella effluvii]|uniref:Dihydroorotate dehydrogenase B (NAD(+)), catalytic subunit n=1 Tax=Hungatella effluvii TaxID=1096246 RepID=A0A2V3Y2L2_9FIRM|nr:HisA/HisF-related TIM barrel protein [Hungatella effluvii]PXX52429.1 dihydroorotate dehydrogenase (NAD+) catalytic subunit [Hungatella effluvii]
MNLNVTLPTPHGDLVLKNPIMPAAGTFGYAIEYEKAMNLNCLGAIVPNSMAITEGQPSTARRFYQSDYGFISSFGANNISYKTFIHEILPRLPYETTPVFIDIKAYDLNELTEFVSILSEVKELAGMEINLNCPYGNFAVPSYWKDMEQLKEMVLKVKAAAGDKILWFKAPTAEYPVQQIVSVVQDHGGDAFVSFNAIGGYAVDIETRKFRSGSGGGGGYSGPGIKPYAMMCAHNSSKAAKIPVIGGGGITCARDVLEYIMAGAHAVQIGSANLMRPDFMERLIEELYELMDKMKIDSLDGIRGCAEYM